LYVAEQDAPLPAIELKAGPAQLALSL